MVSFSICRRMRTPGCVGEPLHLLNADKVIPEDLSGGVSVPAAPGEDPAQVYPLPAQGPRPQRAVSAMPAFPE